VLGFLDPQPHYATSPIEFALGYPPVQTQSQQFMKQLFGCHASFLPPLSTENSEEPEIPTSPKLEESPSDVPEVCAT
jgi:hypothetical protein